LVFRFTDNIENGLPAAYDTVDLNDVTNADVTLTDGNIFIVWQDDNSGTVKFRKGTFTTATGIEENNSSGSFSVSPNPYSQYMNLQLTATGDGLVLVTNSLGQEVFSKEISNSENSIQINTSEWNNGIYFITFLTGKIIRTQKIFKAD